MRRPGVPDVGVIGAGIVDLATAYALAERGASVRVYESSVPRQQAPALGGALAAAALGDGLMDDLRPEARLGEPR